jgi:hypothetical protein
MKEHAMADEASIGSDSVYIFVGEDVNLSEDSTKALKALAATLTAEQRGDEVSGFEFEEFEFEAAHRMMMGGGGGGGGGPVIEVTTNCAIDFVIKIPL